MSTRQKPALSISQLDMLSKCGEQYRRRYVERERIAPGAALIVGKSVDKSVDVNMQSKIDTGTLVSSEQISDVARDTIAEEWDKGEVAIVDGDTQEKARAGAIDKAVRLSLLHAKEAAPLIQPRIVQRNWRIDLQAYPVDITGKTDIEEINGTIRDTKTSGKSPRQDEAHVSDQLTMYALARRVIDGDAEVKVALDYLVDLKTPKFVARESIRKDDDFRVMLRRIETGIKAIESGIFVPARQADWWCSLKWCGYAPTCPYFRRSVSVSVLED